MQGRERTRSTLLNYLRFIKYISNATECVPAGTLARRLRDRSLRLAKLSGRGKIRMYTSLCVYMFLPFLSLSYSFSLRPLRPPSPHKFHPSLEQRVHVCTSRNSVHNVRGACWGKRPTTPASKTTPILRSSSPSLGPTFANDGNGARGLKGFLGGGGSNLIIREIHRSIPEPSPFPISPLPSPACFANSYPPACTFVYTYTNLYMLMGSVYASVSQATSVRSPCRPSALYNVNPASPSAPSLLPTRPYFWTERE